MCQRSLFQVSDNIRRPFCWRVWSWSWFPNISSSVNELNICHSSLVLCLPTEGKSTKKKKNRRIHYFLSKRHTCCLDRVAALVVERRRQGNVGTGRAATALHSLKQLRKPHPQPVVTTYTHAHIKTFTLKVKMDVKLNLSPALRLH